MHENLTARWNSVSLRTKITGVTVLLVTLGLLVAGVGTSTVLRNYLLGEVDSNITAAATSTSVPTLLSQNCILPGPNDGYYLAVVNEQGAVTCQNKQDHAPVMSGMQVEDVTVSGNPRVFTLLDESGHTEWRTVAVVRENAITGDQVALIVAQNLDSSSRTIAQFAGIFLGFGLSVVILGAALTRLLVTSTFAPLRQVEATAAAIADGNFSERLPGDTPNTEVGRLNRSLNTMLARIDRAFGDRANTISQMRRFVGDASHELRTPLVSVRGYAELYRMGALRSPEEVGQAMERIEKEAIRMGELVEDLLELARIDEAKTPHFAPVDLVPIAYDAALDAMASDPGRTISVVIEEAELDDEDAAESAEEEPTDAPESEPAFSMRSATKPIVLAGTRLTKLRARRARTGPIDPSPPTDQPSRRSLDTPAIVLAEENKIRQVLSNLLGNAMRFTDVGSPIEIAVRVKPDRGVAQLDVIDHGDGIPPQIREKIFQRFWRADSSRTRETGGSGLGLAIVSGIVTAHGGTVEALETPGGGATFCITLPLLPETETPALSPAAR